MGRKKQRKQARADLRAIALAMLGVCERLDGVDHISVFVDTKDDQSYYSVTVDGSRCKELSFYCFPDYEVEVER